MGNLNPITKKRGGTANRQHPPVASLLVYPASQLPHPFGIKPSARSHGINGNALLDKKTRHVKRFGLPFGLGLGLPFGDKARIFENGLKVHCRCATHVYYLLYRERVVYRQVRPKSFANLVLLRRHLSDDAYALFGAERAQVPELLAFPGRQLPTVDKGQCLSRTFQIREHMEIHGARI